MNLMPSKNKNELLKKSSSISSLDCQYLSNEYNQGDDFIEKIGEIDNVYNQDSIFSDNSNKKNEYLADKEYKIIISEISQKEELSTDFKTGNQSVSQLNQGYEYIEKTNEHFSNASFAEEKIKSYNENILLNNFSFESYNEEKEYGDLDNLLNDVSYLIRPPIPISIWIQDFCSDYNSSIDQFSLQKPNYLLITDNNVQFKNEVFEFPEIKSKKKKNNFIPIEQKRDFVAEPIGKKLDVFNCFNKSLVKYLDESLDYAPLLGGTLKLINEERQHNSLLGRKTNRNANQGCLSDDFLLKKIASLSEKNLNMNSANLSTENSSIEFKKEEYYYGSSNEINNNISNRTLSDYTKLHCLLENSSEKELDLEKPDNWPQTNSNEIIKTSVKFKPMTSLKGVTREKKFEIQKINKKISELKESRESGKFTNNLISNSKNACVENPINESETELFKNKIEYRVDNLLKRIKINFLTYFRNKISEHGLSQKFVTDVNIKRNKEFNKKKIIDIVLEHLKEQGLSQESLEERLSEIRKRVDINLKFSEFFEQIYLPSKECKQKLDEIRNKGPAIYSSEYEQRLEKYVHYYETEKGHKPSQKNKK